MNARNRKLVDGLVQRAINTEAPLLARDLGAYATSEGLTWDGLARVLGGTPDGLNQVALCQPPRPACFADDVKAIAGDHVDADRLLAVLRQLQVLGAFSGFPEAAAPALRAVGEGLGVMLAARDHEVEGDEPPGAPPAVEPGEDPGDAEAREAGGDHHE